MKKFLSTLLCCVMIAALLPMQIASANVTVWQTKVPLLNASNYNDRELINKYTRDISSWWPRTVTLSAGPLFKIIDKYDSFYSYGGAVNENSKTFGIFYTATYQGCSNGYWYTKFKLKDSVRNETRFQELADSGHLMMRFVANISGNASMSFGEVSISGSGKKDSGWFTVSKDDMMNKEFVMSGSNGATVGKPYVLFADITSPTISSAKISDERLELIFNENLRTLSNRNDVELTLLATNLESGVQNIELKAKMIDVGLNSVEFNVENPDNLKEYQITKIKSISYGGSEFIGRVVGIYYTDEYLARNEEPRFEKVDNEVSSVGDYYTSTASIVDVAGNAADIHTQDLTPFSLVVDKNAPKIDNVEIDGNMITATSTAYSQASDWPEDIDRSSVFVGAGDTLTFSMMTDEEIKFGDNGSVTAELNVKQDGSNVQLELDKTENVYDGVNKRKATKITFKPITITSDMTSAVTNEPIKIIKINASNVTDLYDNNLETQEVSCVPRQHIYFDNTAPTIEIGAIGGDVNNGDFYIPVTLNDGTGIVSGFVGLTADFAWVYDQNKQVPFKYAVTYTSDTPPDKEYKDSILDSEASAAWNNFIVPVSKYYIHIKTDGDEFKNTKLCVRTEDWAGNAGENKADVDISIDRTKPQIALISMNEEYADNDSAKIIAKVRVTDFNMDGISVKYQLVDKGAEPVDGNWTDAELNGGEFTFEKTFNSAAQYEKELLVTAVDYKGNTSDTARYSACVDLTKAKAKYSINCDLSQLLIKPDIKISSPDNPNGKTCANTRVTLKMGDASYVKTYSADNIVKNENIFDYNAGWYAVTYNTDATQFKSADEFSDISTLSNYYGVINVKFESAFSDLLPAAGKSIKPEDNAELVTYQEEGGFDIMSAPVIEGVHGVEFKSITNDKGEILASSLGVSDGSGSNKRIDRKIMSGLRINYTLKNLKVPEWGINNIDFEKSYARVVNSEGEEVYRNALSRNADQTFVMPDRDKDGNLLGTDAYRLEVYVYQTGNTKADKFICDTWILLDNTKASENVGVRKYVINPQSDFSPLMEEVPAITKESDTSIKDVNIGISEFKEIDRNYDDAYSLEQNGASIVTLTLQSDNVEKELLGTTTGKIEGFRMWNKACTGGEDLPFKKTTGNTREYELNLLRYTVPDTLDGVAADGTLQIAKGTNTMCYQVKMENGNVSPIYEFNVNTTEKIPQLSMNIKMNEAKNYTDDNGTIHVLSADATVENAFSENGNVKVYHVYRGENGYYTKWMPKEMQIGTDTVNFGGCDYFGYQNYTDEGSKSKEKLKDLFVAVDECGNSVVYIPQFKEGTKYTFESEALNVGLPQLNTYNKGRYIYNITAQNVDDTKGSVVVEKTDGTTVEMPLNNPSIPNEIGYESFYYSPDDTVNNISLKFTRPWSTDKVGERMFNSITFNFVGKHGDTCSKTYRYDDESFNSLVTDFVYEAPRMTNVYDDTITEDKSYNVYNRGVKVYFNGSVKLKNGSDYSVDHYLPIFTNGIYDIECEDLFGNTWTVPVNVTVLSDGPKVTVSPMYQTKGEVTVTMESDAYKIGVSEKEGNVFADIINNNTNKVTAYISQPTEITMTWNDGTGEKSRTLNINNNEIKPIDPEIEWDYSDDDVTDGSVYGSVTAFLVDKNGSKLKDNATGGAVSHTFYPGDDTSYTFTNYSNQLGTQGPDFTAELAVTVKEYQAPEDTKDTVKPSVGIVGYTVRNGLAQCKNLVLNLYDDNTEYLNPSLPEYEGYETVTDSMTFMQKMGWASQYRFNVNIADWNAVKLIAKNGLNAQAPSYNSSSDVIDGVSVNGRTVDITKNAEFTLFAVDSEGNYKEIPIIADNVGQAPAPHLEKVVSGDLQTVKVYLIAPDDSEYDKLVMLNTDAKQETASGNYNGLYYLEFTENKDAVVDYSYRYKGSEETGTLNVSVTEIDKSPAIVTDEDWSKNAESKKTNKDVTVQLRFNKFIKDAVWENGPSDAPEIYKLDNQVTVSYSKNTPSLTLVCTAVNGQTCKVVLNEVSNIDKELPVISETSEVSENRKKVTVSLKSDKEVIFREMGKQGTEFTKKITQNGEYTFHFADAAGNLTEKTITVDSIVSEPLTLMFSLSGDGADSKSSPEQLGTVKIGDTVYIKANRNCTVTWGGENTGIDVNDGSWSALEVKADNAGIYPVIKAVDEYTNAKFYHFGQIAMPDMKAPDLTIKKETVDIDLNSSDEDIMAVLKANVTAIDDTTAQDNIIINAEYTKSVTVGNVIVKYTAQDEAGNVTTKYGYIHFYKDNQLRVSVNGVSVYREMVLVSESGAQNITVETGGEPYTVTYKKGIKTIGQMKIGSTVLAADKENSETVVFTPEKSGYYTFVVKTQGRDSYRFVVYVK